jgi:hypothetical protein
MSDYIEIWREFQPHKFVGMTDAEGDMAREIERLRARVEVLEMHLRRMIELDMPWNEVHAAIDAARAALEAKP